jgi:hypothetical protein
MSVDRKSSSTNAADSVFCPLTQNKKFEIFLDDLFDLKADLFRTKKEIVNYMQIVETFYTDKLHRLKT